MEVGVLELGIVHRLIVRAAVVGACALAQPIVAGADEVSDRIVDILRTRTPDLAISSVRKLDGVDLYEVIDARRRVFYVDPQARFGLFGTMYDLQTRANLTSARIDEISYVDFAQLPLDKAFVRVKGSGARKLAIFSDPDCPFCQRLEQELEGISDVSLYMFLYPIESLHPGATARARKIWCAPDRAAAWDKLMRERLEPDPADDTCGDPIEDLALVGERLALAGTPALIFPDGKLVPGAIPREEIESLLTAAHR